jgi:hypothetical protein
MKMNKWPKDPKKTVSFHALIVPLKKALLFGYELKRINVNRNIPYDGYDIGEDSKVASFSPNHKMRADYLRKQLEEHGKDLADYILEITFQLGVEQGKRIFRSDTVTELRGMLLDMLMDKIQDKDLRKLIRNAHKSVINGGVPGDKKKALEIEKKMKNLSLKI